MEDHWVALGDTRHRWADFLYPSGVLMPEDVRQGREWAQRPRSLDDVQVGSADPCPGYAEDDVKRLSCVRFGLVDQLKWLVVGH